MQKAPHIVLTLTLGVLSAVVVADPEDTTADNAYQTYCASCHGRNFEGLFGPALSGRHFKEKWSAAPAPSLLSYIETMMPPAAPGSLPAETYAQIHDTIAKANALPPSNGAGAPGIASSQQAPTTEIPDIFVVSGNQADEYVQKADRKRKSLLQRLSPVTDELLAHPPDGDWPMWRRALDTLGYSPLKQINRTTARRLTLAWSRALTPGINAIAPLVHDGVMFLNASGKVMALNATNGDLLWEYAGTAGVTHHVPLSQPRTIALYGERVYVPTLDGHVLALDMRSGNLLKDYLVFSPEEDLQISSGPLVVRGKLFQGVAGCQGTDYPGGCFISAIDLATGRQLWRFHTISRPGQPGADSWNGAEVQERFGASVWIPGSYDPELNLLYFGTGQTYQIATLLLPNARRGESTDALFTDSTLALDPDTGRLVWFYQHLSSDVWDMDWAFEQMLITLKTSTGPRKAVMTGGKIGVFDVLDARTGQYISSGDMGLQTLVQSIDPKTGHKVVNPTARFGPGHYAFVCPFLNGVRDWPSTSYDPVLQLLFVPMVESCMDIGMTLGDHPGFDVQQKVNPNSNGLFGRVGALNLRTQRVVWANRRRAAQASATLATAGGLVFEGASDRTFRALESRTGKVLWETPLNETPNAFPISFEADGTQYVAIVTGGGTTFDATYRHLTPEIARSTRARTIWAFRLNGKDLGVTH